MDFEDDDGSVTNLTKRLDLSDLYSRDWLGLGYKEKGFKEETVPVKAIRKRLAGSGL